MTTKEKPLSVEERAELREWITGRCPFTVGIHPVWDDRSNEYETEIVVDSGKLYMGEPCDVASALNAISPLLDALEAAESELEKLRLGITVCDSSLLRNGTGIAILAGGCSESIEALIVRLRREVKDTEVDWHYVGGRAHVVARGNVSAASRWLESHAPMQIMVIKEEAQETLF